MDAKKREALEAAGWKIGDAAEFLGLIEEDPRPELQCGRSGMINPLSGLLERSRRPSRIVVGLMSGTSADSIDVAVCRMKGQGTDVEVELIHYREHPHDPEVKRRVIGVADLDVRGIAELNVMIGEAFAAACLGTLQVAGISPDGVDLIGSHGQTVYHHSGMEGALRATLQIGDGDVIAVRTGCYVISDFRAGTSQRAARVRRSRRSPTSCFSEGEVRTKTGDGGRS